MAVITTKSINQDPDKGNDSSEHQDAPVLDIRPNVDPGFNQAVADDPSLADKHPKTKADLKKIIDDAEVARLPGS